MRETRMAGTLFRNRKFMNMKAKAATLGLLVTALAGTVSAGEGPVPKGIPRLDHVFVIMM